MKRKRLSLSTRSQLHDVLVFADRHCGRCLVWILEDLDVSDWWLDEILKKLSRKRWSEYPTEKDDLLAVQEILMRLLDCRHYRCAEKVMQQFGLHLTDAALPELRKVIDSL